MIEEGLDCAGAIPQIAFYGGSFTAIPEEMQIKYLETAYDFIRSGRASGVRISTRPDAIDRRTLERLKRFRVDTIELGAQSMDNRVLHASGRGHTREDVISASQMIW